MAALLELPIFVWLPPKRPKAPPGPYFALVVCVGTPKRSVPTRLPTRTLGWRIEITLDMKMRAKLPQRTLGGGENRGVL